jgi:hypothetical protein
VALVWTFRIGVMLAPTVFRYASSGGSPPTQGFSLFLQEHWRKWVDAAVSAVDASDSLTAELPEGSFIAVTDHAAPFETRKLTARFTRAPAGMVAEDIDVINLSFLKAPGGVPTDAWITSDYTTLETAFLTLWGSLKTRQRNYVTLSELRWYADGPAYHPAPPGGNPARRVTTESVPGTSAAVVGLPPQDAETITFKTSTRRAWGRVYFPAQHGDSNDLNANGNLTTGAVDAYCAAFVTFFNAARAASLIPVVFSRTHSIAYEITSVQVDDLIDVMRKRRWKRADYKKETVLT